ncbi:hypothetical protein ACIBCB_09615 [Streptomyces uncialis]|uniref:ABC transporter ATP-binding protein n=1 Tax=Streptomyces uncialis TaxID=1048205 RepID=UPI0037AC51A6
MTVQAQILRLLAERKAPGTALLLISHDLSVVVARLADRVMLMKDGLVVEEGPARQLLATPRHPYTRQLRDAVPTGLRRARDHAARPVTAAPTVPAAGDGTQLIEARGLYAVVRRTGDAVSEPDVQLWPTLARFDLAYNPVGASAAVASVWAYARDLYRLPAFPDTTDFGAYRMSPHPERAGGVRHIDVDPADLGRR